MEVGDSPPMDFREISYLKSTIKSIAKFIFLLKTDNKTVYMKTYVHFFIIETDGVLFGLGAKV
jgi:hypothetical protein